MGSMRNGDISAASDMACFTDKRLVCYGWVGENIGGYFRLYFDEL